jgi:hypothetical protein
MLAQYVKRLRQERNVETSNVSSRSFRVAAVSVPDMLQDLKNLGMPADNLEALFSSAEAYLKMWEKTWDASGCASKADCQFRRDESTGAAGC